MKKNKLNILNFKTLFFCFLLCTCLSCHEQKYFEGIIIYDIDYKSYDPRVDTNELKKFYGTKAHLNFRDGNMKWELENAYWLSSLYLKEENKIYYQTNTDTIYWEDGAELTEEINKIKIDTINKKILDYKCNLLIVETQPINPADQYINRKRYFYYSTDLKIDPLWFSRCNYNNLNVIYAKTQSLPLKIIDQFETFKIEYTAIKIEDKPLKEKIFNLEHILPLKKIE